MNVRIRRSRKFVRLSGGRDEIVLDKPWTPASLCSFFSGGRGRRRVKHAEANPFRIKQSGRVQRFLNAHARQTWPPRLTARTQCAQRRELSLFTCRYVRLNDRDESGSSFKLEYSLVTSCIELRRVTAKKTRRFSNSSQRKMEAKKRERKNSRVIRWSSIERRGFDLCSSTMKH